MDKLEAKMAVTWAIIAAFCLTAAWLLSVGVLEINSYRVFGLVGAYATACLAGFYVWTRK